MENIITAVQYFIHENKDELKRAEANFTIATKPLYKAMVLGLIGLVILFVIGLWINVEHNQFKKYNLLVIFVTNPLIALYLLHARNIFKVALTGTVYGVVKSKVSGLSGGTTLLKEYISAGLYLMAGVTCAFGTLSLIDFSWTSATFGIIFFTVMIFTTVANKLK